MAIVANRHTINGRDFILTTSDSGRYVVRDGISYEEADDPAEFGRTYTEGDAIPPSEENALEILSILMGGAE